MINHKTLRLTKLALALSIALAASVPAMAQNTTSAIGGRVSISDGKPAAGAKVTIVHTESGSVSNVVADADGRYSARGLRVGGPYTVTITKDGVTEKYDNVFLTLAETATVDVQLGGPAMQTVTIAGQAAGSKFNRSSMGSGTSIGRAELAALASVSRSLADYARNDPRLAQTDKDRGEISAGGQNSRYNSITIDGVSISDTFGLEFNGLPTNKQPISIDSIQSVQVNISNYDVTQKGYTGANINAVTKSGTNDWKGSAYRVYRDERVSGDLYNQTSDTYSKVPAFSEKTNGLTIGGPLIKDKLFLFASAEDSNSSRSSPSFGPLGSNLTNVGITPSAIAGVQQIARDKYGFDAGSPNVAYIPVTVRDRLVKLDWNINDDHRANFRWQKTQQQEQPRLNYSPTNLYMTSQLYTEIKPIESSVAQLFSDWTPNFSTEAKISRRDSGKSYTNAAFLPSMSLQQVGGLPAGSPAGVSTSSRFLNFGTDFSRHFNSLDTKTLDAYFGGTWTHGSHEVKGGIDFTKNDVFNAFVQGTNGSYTFNCITSSATVTYSFGAVNCQTSPAALIEQAALENFSRGRPVSYSATMPVAGATLNDSAAIWTLANTGLFLQDTWTISPRLTMTFGARYDKASTDDRPRKNEKVALPAVAGTYGTTAATLVRATGGFGIDNQVTIDGDALFQPRVGFNYRLATVRNTQVRGGMGLFGGAAANVWLGNPFANNGMTKFDVGCGGSFAPCVGEGLFSPDPLKQRAIAGTAPAVAVDVLAPGLSQPSVWKANVAVDHELPWFGMVASLEYLHTNVKSGLYFQNLNLGAPTRTGTDGRPMFWTETGYTASCANGTGGFTTSGACAGHRNRALSNGAYTNVIRIAETDKGGGNLATLQLSSSKSRELKWSLAYTYTDATEVSNLSSSTANSSWNGRPSFNPNEEVVANSTFLVKDRINASLTWEKRFFDVYKTTFGAFYEGKTGKPFSWTFNNDMNGDGANSNDLMYIPKAFGSGDVVFRGDSATSKVNETKFWAYVDAHPELKRSAGGVTHRNDSYAPWVNSVDLRLTQEVPGFKTGHKGVFVLDFMNFGNLLNKKWGRINEVAFSGGTSRSFVDYAGMQDGKYVYQMRDVPEDYIVKQEKLESQWAIQATMRYEF
jgi:hypothetical protein